MREISTLESNAEALLQVALRQFDTSVSTQEREQLPGAGRDGLATAILHIDRNSNELTDYSGSAAELFGFEDGDLANKPWRELLGGAAGQHPLDYAIDSGIQSALPPMALNLSRGCELVVCGLVTPDRRPGSSLTMLALRALNHPEISFIAKNTQPGDAIAVLGVDQIEYGADWNADATQRFMMDIRSSLLEITRADDVVSLPQGNYITIILRQIGVEEALNLANAFLSHLSSIPQLYGPPVAKSRFCVGLASMGEGITPLGAVVSANNALLCTQQCYPSVRVKTAAVGDKNKLLGSSYVTEGIFTEHTRGPDYLEFMRRLLAVGLHSQDRQQLTKNIMGLLATRPGVNALAIFRQSRDSRFRFVVGAKVVDDDLIDLAEAEAAVIFPSGGGVPDLTVVGPTAFRTGRDNVIIQPLVYRQTVLGYLALEADEAASARIACLSLDADGLHYLAETLPGLKERHDAPEIPGADNSHSATPLNLDITGYVVDNMEGAVDQASFLAKIDMPVAIVGPRGTGKMYVAKIVHQEAGGAADMIDQIDCREFRNRDDANTRLATVLEQSEGKTLVFKSPHFMSPEAQVKLARQISTRTLADVKPARYLPVAKYVALFPESLDRLVSHSGLSEKLASVFAGYPITVPPLRDRKQAVLRWAHKILGQESTARDRPVKGFTPDAEQAMLAYEWPGNISEMRRCIVGALERTDKNWITPVDLGIFKGISAQGRPSTSEPEPFLTVLEQAGNQEEEYLPTALENLNVALGEAMNSVALEGSDIPLGTWAEDELVLAVWDRYQGDLRPSAEFLHTRPRNISRWMTKIQEGRDQRNTSPIWRAPRRLIAEWVRETPYLEESPRQLLQKMLFSHVSSQCADASVARKAKIMGISVPTYHKYQQQLSAHQDN